MKNDDQNQMTSLTDVKLSTLLQQVKQNPPPIQEQEEIMITIDSNNIDTLFIYNDVFRSTFESILFMLKCSEDQLGTIVYDHANKFRDYSVIFNIRFTPAVLNILLLRTPSHDILDALENVSKPEDIRMRNFVPMIDLTEFNRGEKLDLTDNNQWPLTVIEIALYREKDSTNLYQILDLISPRHVSDFASIIVVLKCDTHGTIQLCEKILNVLSPKIRANTGQYNGFLKLSKTIQSEYHYAKILHRKLPQDICLALDCLSNVDSNDLLTFAMIKTTREFIGDIFCKASHPTLQMQSMVIIRCLPSDFLKVWTKLTDITQEDFLLLFSKCNVNDIYFLFQYVDGAFATLRRIVLLRCPINELTIIYSMLQNPTLDEYSLCCKRLADFKNFAQPQNLYNIPITVTKFITISPPDSSWILPC